MAKTSKQKRLVFLSHSSKDTWVAKQIAREISDCGAKPFLDEAEIDIGSDFEEEILANLEKADELVVLLTPWALERPYVWAELGAAWGRRIPIQIFSPRNYSERITGKTWNPRIPKETESGRS
jgi:hypothetical protein